MKKLKQTICTECGEDILSVIKEDGDYLELCYLCALEIERQFLHDLDGYLQRYERVKEL